MKKNKKKKNKKKRAPDPPGYLRPNSFVPRAPKGTHAGEGSLASEKVSLPTSHVFVVWLSPSDRLFLHCRLKTYSRQQPANERKWPDSAICLKNERSE